MKKTALTLLLALLACGYIFAQKLAPVNPAYLDWVQNKAFYTYMNSLPAEGGWRVSGRIPAPFNSFGRENTAKTVVPLPDKYDLRDESRVSPIRDQAAYGTCWTFGALASMEGNWLTQHPGGSVFYSSFNMVRACADLYGTDLQGGGNYLMSTSYFARLLGPVYEKDDPYLSGISGVPPAPASKPKVRGCITEAVYFPLTINIDESRMVVDGVLDEDCVSRIKESVMQKGVIDFSYYHGGSYYNSGKASYYCNSDQYPNHEIAIVGWDDNYSRYNFTYTAPANGAWLARNSWGPDWGDEGYFWISYYDRGYGDFCQFSMTDDTSRYSGVCQLEESGLATALDTVYSRNIFTMKSDCTLKDVGVYCVVGSNTIKCKIFVNGSKVAEGSKYCEDPGYYFIPVKASCSKGDKVTCQVQYAAAPSDDKYYSALSRAPEDAKAKTSLFSPNGSDWYDTTTDLGSKSYVNCIKLYTAGAPVAVTGVSLDKTALSLNKGGTYTLAATVKPSNATNKDVSWSSSDTAVAKVSSAGKVTAAGAGTCTITVKTKDGGFTAKCKVTVTDNVPVTGVTLSETEIKLKKGESRTLTVTVKPSNATNKKVTWTSDDTSIAVVSSAGKVTAKGAGTVKIRVKTKDGGFSAKCKVRVTVPVTGVTLNKREMTLLRGASETLTATVAPADATNKNLKWKSYDESIVTISSSGTVKAVAGGKTKVRVKTRDGGFTAYCWITVKVPVTGVSLDKTALTLNVGDSKTLTATVAPSDATNKNLKWKSYDTAIATVDANGKVKAVAKGTTTIRVQTKDGDYRAKCKLTVK